MTRRNKRISAIMCFFQFFALREPMESIIETFEHHIVPEHFSEYFVMFDTDFKDLLVAAIEHEQLIIKTINAHIPEGWTFNRLPLIERAILFMAISELTLEFDDKAIIINEAVEIAKMFCEEGQHKYINGLLDNLAL